MGRPVGEGPRQQGEEVVDFHSGWEGSGNRFRTGALGGGSG
jgi:hypothetical protein